MVSSEGACAAYFNYGRFLSAEDLATAGAGTDRKRAVEPGSMADKAGTPDFSNWSCPLPLVGYPTIVMGHGGGGKLGNELVEHLFLPAFRNPALENLGDAAVFELGSGRVGDEHRFVCRAAAVFSRRIDRRAGRERHRE